MKEVACIALGLLIVSSLLGCNTQGKSEASDILNKSISKMNNLSSLKETDATVASTKDEGTQTTTLKAEYDLPAKKNHTVTTTEDSGDVTTTYSYGGYLYMSVSEAGGPVHQWQKQKVGGARSTWLNAITKMSKDPKSVRVISENPTTYELGLDVKRQLVDLVLYGYVNANPKATTDAKQAAKEKAVQNMNSSVVLTVDKDTSYLTRADIKIDVPAMPDIGDMSLKEDIRFYDFNKPVNIVLPTDAQSAKSPSGK